MMRGLIDYAGLFPPKLTWRRRRNYAAHSDDAGASSCRAW